MQSIQRHHPTLSSWFPRLTAIAAMAIVAIVAAQARATEIIPSVGITSSVHDSDRLTKGSVGLALRGDLGPLKPEISASYRTESRFDGTLEQRMWPVTASLWLAPVPMLYAGAGVGWYHTTFDYDQRRVPLIADETHEDFGVHVGGGVRVPVAPAVGVDLQGRYVMMQKQESRLVPSQFNPDFWTLSAGLALHF